MMKKSNKVFISYAREDLSIAKIIYNDLASKGIEAWIDIENIFPGEYWKLKIIQVIKECRYFIALLSKNSINKAGFVQKELKLAFEILDEYPMSNIFIIPVRLDDCDINEDRLSEIQWVDIFLDYRKGINKIYSLFSSNNDKYLRKHDIVNIEKASSIPREKISEMINSEENKICLTREPFETIEEYKDRIQKLNFFAGTGVLKKDKYDYKTGIFPLSINWRTDVSFPRLESEDYERITDHQNFGYGASSTTVTKYEDYYNFYIVVDIKIAKFIYESGPEHDIYIKFSAGEDSVSIEKITLDTKFQKLDVVYNKFTRKIGERKENSALSLISFHNIRY